MSEKQALTNPAAVCAGATLMRLHCGIMLGNVSKKASKINFSQNPLMHKPNDTIQIKQLCLWTCSEEDLLKSLCAQALRAQ